MIGKFANSRDGNHAAQHGIWQQVYERGDNLYLPGEPLSSLFVIRAGVIKTCLQTEDGAEQIIGFHMAGDIVGLDAIAGETYTRSATAVDTTTACALPFSDIAQMCRELPGLQREMMRQMSQTIMDGARFQVMLTTKHANERVAAFLLDIADWHGHHGYSSSEFNMPMSRADIANYLNIKPETISRILSRFQNSGLLSMNRKQFRILDREALSRQAGKPRGENIQLENRM
ncbi:MAG: helix-turn-helix domain-containing protein [Pseudomonadota bacterium]|nr:helix-turn-helix domain-containing protein [Pseudomonadota bacterium]